MSAADDAVSLVDLPREVSARIMRLLDARDLAALRSTCRAFDASLVEAAALEAVRARAPWLLDPACGASSDPDETRVATLRFAELADAADLPALLASESTTVVIDRHGGYHSWGPVVDLLGEEDPEEDREEEDPESPGRATLRRPPGDPQATLPQTHATLGRPSGDRGSPRLRRPRRHPRRVACAATSEAFNVVAGVGGSDPLTILRNASGVPRDFSTGDSRRRSPAASTSSSPSGSSLDRLLASLRVAPDRRAFGPSARVVSIAVGRMHVLCATSRGDAYAWGGDAAGQLGHGAVADRVGLARLALGGEGGDPRGASRTGSRSRRRSKRGDAGAGGGYESPPRWSGGFGGGFKGTTTRRGGSNASASANYSNANAAYRDDDASASSASSASSARCPRPRRVVALAAHRVVSVAAAAHASAAVTDAGALFTWGSGRHGALGLGDAFDRDAPCRVTLARSANGSAGRSAAEEEEEEEEEEGEEEGGEEEGSSGGSEGRGNSSDDDSFRRRPSGRSSPLGAPRRTSSPTPPDSDARFFYPGAMSTTDDEEDRDSRSSGSEGSPPIPSSARRAGSSAPPRMSRRRANRPGALARFVSFGERHCAAVTAGGALYCWGDNGDGQCGFDPGRAPRLRWPVEVSLARAAREPRGGGRPGEGGGIPAPLDPGDADDAFFSSDASDSEASEEEGPRGGASRSARRLPRTGVRVVRASAGGRHTLACDASGALYAFGSRIALGHHREGDGGPAPPHAVRLFAHTEGGNARRARIVRVAAGGAHSAAMTDAGEVYAWGDFDFEAGRADRPRIRRSEEDPNAERGNVFGGDASDGAARPRVAAVVPGTRAGAGAGAAAGARASG